MTRSATERELDEAADETLELLCRWDPFLMSATGVPDAAGLVPDPTDDGVDRLRVRALALSRRLAALTDVREQLGADDLLTLRMATWHTGLVRDVLDAHRENWTCTPYKAWSLPTAIWSVLPKTALPTAHRSELLLRRVQQLPDALAATRDSLSTGVSTGAPPVTRLVEDVVDQVRRVLRAPLSALLDQAWRAAAPETLTHRGAVEAELDGPVTAALADLVSHLERQVAPRSRGDDRPGLCWIEDGESFYATSVREHTTTELSAAEIHQRGLGLVARLRDELAAEAGDRLGDRFSDVELAVDRLRDDPALRFADAEELLARARDAFDRGAAATPQLVGFELATPVELRPMPEVEARRMMQAYYRPGDATTGTPGIFWLNTVPERSPTRYELQTLVAHEACPGHHVQWSRARETPLPRYRGFAPTTAFIEGWALYVERRAPEWGLFTDELATLGMLSSQLWRACRLVVDTGIHAHGWSRERAVTYLLRNSATTAGNAEAEIDRYIGNPGQALAYSTGLLAVEEARARAEHVLGSRFDEPAFHRSLLDQGSPPLFLLPDIVDLHAVEIGADPYPERSS